MDKMILRFFTLVTITLVTISCSTYRVNTDFEPAANFSELKTFSWLAEPDTQGVTAAPSPLLISRIKRAVIEQLSSKSYQFVDSADSADFLVNVVLASRVHTGVRSHPYGFGMGLSLHHHRHFFFDTSYETYQFTEGSVAIDFYLRENTTPIWRGSANKNFTGFDADVTEATVKKVVADILQHFPP